MAETNNPDYESFQEYLSIANNYFNSFNASYGEHLSPQHKAILTSAMDKLLYATISPASFYVAYQQNGIPGLVGEMAGGALTDFVVARVAAYVGGTVVLGTAGGVITGIIVGVSVGYGISYGLDLVQDADWYEIIDKLQEWAADESNGTTVLEPIVVDSDTVGVYRDKIQDARNAVNSLSSYFSANLSLEKILSGETSWNEIKNLMDSTGDWDAINLLSQLTTAIVNLANFYQENKAIVEGISKSIDNNISIINALAQTLDTYLIEKIHETIGEDPLVLDLNGDGVQTISILDSTTKFDLTEQTEIAHGWISPEDGFLALDKNKNGVIDSRAELFGSEDHDGFTLLAEYDLNRDGIIDASDEIYDALLVWQDANSDGVSQASELSSLQGLGIASINLSATFQAVSNQLNDVPLTSSYTLNDGTTREIADVYFTVATQEAKPVVDISTSNSLVVVGSASNDTLAGNERDQLFIGGTGQDTFVFADTSGHDVIADFDVAEDVIELHLEQSATISSILYGSSQDGNNAIINIDPNTSITLWNVDLASLTNDNFNFVAAA